MKKVTLRFRRTNKPTFDAIKTGRKTVETRAATRKYQNINVGDILVLACGNYKFEKRIKKIQKFKTIHALLVTIRLHKVNPLVSTLKEAEKVYDSYPDYKEKIKKFGIIAFYI